MDITEVLNVADLVLFTNTGKHLDDIQKHIITGVFQGKKYSKIAEERHCTEGHVRDIASELWQLLSQLLGEEITKFNLRSTLERQTFYKASPKFEETETSFIQINNVNFSRGNSQSPRFTILETINQNKFKEETPNLTLKVSKLLDDAPEIYTFYGRTQELTTLKKWVVEDNCRLLAILGVVGIGKTAIAVKLIEQIQDKFDFIFWRSLRSKPQLESIEKEFI